MRGNALPEHVRAKRQPKAEADDVQAVVGGYLRFRV